MALNRMGRLLVLGIAAGGLSACEPGTNPFGPRAGADPTVDATVNARASGSTRLVDRDVEAPEVFQATDEALWDGRPSLGGVWVASPEATDPERVVLRNPANGRFVIGALFRRERDNPGPRLQISSDAAEALGLLAGQPATISVTALRRDEAPAGEPDAANPILAEAEGVAEAGVDTTIAAASAAIDAAEGAISSAPLDEPAAAPASGGTPAAAPAAATGGPLRVQIGIFSVEANATRAVARLAEAGVAAGVRPEQSAGKSIWSVVATGGGDRAALLSKIRGLGFADAYFLR